MARHASVPDRTTADALTELSERHEVRVRGRDQTVVFIADSHDGRLIIRQEKEGKKSNDICAITLSNSDELRAFFQGLRRIMLIDISDRKRADAHGQRLASIVESSEDAIVSKDLNGIITSWNGGAERLFGYRAEEVIGRPITILIPEDRIDEEPEIIGRVRRGERVDHYDTVRRRKDGSLVDISLTVSPLKDANGRIVGASKIARDITERKRAQEQQKLLVHDGQADGSTTYDSREHAAAIHFLHRVAPRLRLNDLTFLSQ